MTVAPMLATLGSAADIDEDTDSWAFEMKWDGIRAVATVHNSIASFVTRNGIDVSASYPELAELGRRTGGRDVVVDGEIVALNKRGRPDFGRLQRRMNLTRKPDVYSAMRNVPVQYLIFDILEANGKSVAANSYDQRRAELGRTVRAEGHIQVPPAFHGNLVDAFASSRELGLEGVMAKRRDSSYAG